MADRIKNYFMKTAFAKMDTQLSIPGTAAIGTQFCGVKMIDTNNIPSAVTSLDPGSFTGTDEDLGTFREDSSRKTFPDNWHKDVTGENEPFTMQINYKNLLLVYKKTTSDTFGEAEVTVDGETVTFDGNPSDAWGNPWTVVLLDEETSSSHTIEIKMSDADKLFSILAFGYTP